LGEELRRKKQAWKRPKKRHSRPKEKMWGNMCYKVDRGDIEYFKSTPLEYFWVRIIILF
jgi:hypothetical protein